MSMNPLHPDHGGGDVFENLHFSLLDEIRVTCQNANLEVARWPTSLTQDPGGRLTLA
jgi:hypothetical protein